MSTFHGLEMAKQALFAQRSALYTTGHNIANAHTDGYSRQRVNFETTSPFPAASRNRPEVPGQVGTGVQIDVVQRLRDRFLDMQYRSEQSKSGYWAAQDQALARLENILNEPSESGLTHTMNQFWQSLQDLSVNPENSGARSVVAGRGESLADTFNYLSNTIETLRNDQRDQINVTVKQANSLLNQINEINANIKSIEPHGYVANDLYDHRDRLLDELSQIVSIQVTHKSSGDGAPQTADGVVTIELADEKGNRLQPPVTLVDGEQGQVNAFDFTMTHEGVTSIHIENHEPISADQFTRSIGSLAAHIETFGYTTEAGSNDGTYPQMIKQLDQLAAALADRFNAVHAEGFGRDESTGLAFFVANQAGEQITAANIQVNRAIVDDPDKIAASSTPRSIGEDGAVATGDGQHAILLSHLFDQPLSEEDWNDGTDHHFSENVSIYAFYESVIGEMGVEAQEAKRMSNNTETLRNQVKNQRLSVSAVSLDEEMSNMIQFQHAYNAAARSMTAIDELLDRIINGMGIVGR